jgi:LCP family protein required for cell wall assembly
MANKKTQKRPKSQTRKKQKKGKTAKRILIAFVLTLLSILLLAGLVFGGYALSLYKKMTIAPVVDTTVSQTKAEAASLLQTGVTLDQILKDEENFRLTLEDVRELEYYYTEWLQSQTGEEDSDPEDLKDLQKDPPSDEPLPPEANKLINILVLGTDERREGVRGRTDAILAVTINTEKKTITVTSFMRDVYVKLAGTDKYNRLNAAYVFGGVGAVQNTIQDYFGLEFDNYAQVNFTSFEKVIDAIGGIEMELTKKEVENLIKHTKLDGGKVFNPDEQKVEGTESTYRLNGKYALRFCRDRYTGSGDFGRTERQRKVLMKVVEKAQSMSFGELMEFIPVVLPMITTDLSIADCTQLLASVGTSYTSYKIQTFRVPADRTWKYATINKMSVLSVDFVENKRLLHQLLFE